jgi:RND family efflux transporter MFP subunit
MGRFFPYLAVLVVTAALMCVSPASGGNGAPEPAGIGPAEEDLGLGGGVAAEPRVAETDLSDFLAATTIHAYRSADVGTEISGIIEKYHFEEGDLVKKSQVVVEISPRRYAALEAKAEAAVEGGRLACRLAQEQVEVMEDLLRQGAATKLEYIKAETDLQIARARLHEAEGELAVARLNLEACRIEAPFTGYLTVRYKKPHEPVRRLEKVFSIVDSSKVYAIANVPAGFLSRFPRGAPVMFIDSAGRRFPGMVERIGRLFDAKSNTKKVYALIENPEGKLEVGMTGTLKPRKPVSQ